MCYETISKSEVSKDRNAKRVAKAALLKQSRADQKTHKSTPTRVNKRKTKLKTKEAGSEYWNIANTSQHQELCSRKRWKTLNEREVLECYFELDSEWTRKTILYLKDLVQLSEKQIYKWGYEKRRRLSLNVPEEKTVDLKYVTKLSDLSKTTPLNNLNSVVDDLFPEQENEEETLSDEQMKVYDSIRDKLVERSIKYDQQSDLDKLLNERIPIVNLAVDAESTLQRSTKKEVLAGKMKAKGYKQGDKEEVQKLNQKALLDNFQNICTKSSAASTECRDFKDMLVNPSNRRESDVRSQIGSELKDQLKEYNNFTYAKYSDSSDDLSEVSYELDFSSGLESLFRARSAPIVHDTTSVEHFSNIANSQILQICDPIAIEEEECRFESFHDLCGAVLYSEDVLDATNN